jgi:hypothetical protein
MRALRTLTAFVFTVCLASSALAGEQTATPFWPTSKPTDSQLDSRHALYQFYSAAQLKKLPANFFRELIAANASVVVRYGDWPRYKPGIFSGGTIYHPAADRAPTTWTNLDWSSFYNELFHAWWGNVFTKATKYQTIRAQILTEERKRHYRQAHRTNPLLAQEEGYSETVASLMVMMYPRYNPSLPDQRGYAPLSDYKYDTGRTVSAVSHGDQPGYDPAAEYTYMNEFEYEVLFKILTDNVPPTEFD